MPGDRQGSTCPCPHRATFTRTPPSMQMGCPPPPPPFLSQRALGLSPLWQAVYKQHIMWAPVFISEQCVKREEQKVKFESRCAVSNVGVIWWSPGDRRLFWGDFGSALVLGGGVRRSSPASPWSCLCISREASGTRRLASAPLQLKQLLWVIGLCSSSSFLPCPYSLNLYSQT